MSWECRCSRALRPTTCNAWRVAWGLAPRTARRSCGSTKRLWGVRSSGSREADLDYGAVFAKLPSWQAASGEEQMANPPIDRDDLKPKINAEFLARDPAYSTKATVLGNR